jgi:hypothetical protein
MNHDPTIQGLFVGYVNGMGQLEQWTPTAGG